MQRDARRRAPIDLTATEFQLLAALARQPGRVFTRAQLLDAVRGSEVESFERAIDAHIKNIRRKLEPDSAQARDTCSRSTASATSSPNHEAASTAVAVAPPWWPANEPWPPPSRRALAGGAAARGSCAASRSLFARCCPQRDRRWPRSFAAARRRGLARASAPIRCGPARVLIVVAVLLRRRDAARRHCRSATSSTAADRVAGGDYAARVARARSAVAAHGRRARSTA